MSERPARFMEAALNGEVLFDEIDDFVERWHESQSDEPLYAFLGMTEQEYSLWLNDPDYLSLILSARHRGQPLVEAVNDNYLGSESISAGGGKIRKVAELRTWLKKQS